MVCFPCDFVFMSCFKKVVCSCAGFFIPGFPKLLRLQQHHDKVLTKLLPKLKKHFDRQNIDAGLYTLKWFFQCFLDRVWTI